MCKERTKRSVKMRRMVRIADFFSNGMGCLFKIAVMEELPDDSYSVYTEPLKVNSLEAGIASRGKCPHVATFVPHFRGHG